MTDQERKQLDAVAVIVELPSAEIDAYAVVVMRTDGLFQTVSDLCCLPHLVGMLADAASCLAGDVAAEQHAVTG